MEHASTDSATLTRDSAQPRSRLRQGLRQLVRRRLSILGVVLIAVVLLMAVFAPLLTRQGPDVQNMSAVLQRPSSAHILGTDDLGRDIWSRLIFGSRISLAVSLAAVTMAVVSGGILGLVAGYAGGLTDEALMRMLDSLMALPSLVLALTIAAVLGTGERNATIAIAVVGIPTYARLIRSQTLSVKQLEFVSASRAIGAPPLWIIVRHLLPNTISPIIVQASLGLGFAIITESSLSFLGLGAQPPTATWGSMIQTGFQYLETAPWFVLAPAVMIFLAVLGFNLVGDGIRDALDPTMSNS